MCLLWRRGCESGGLAKYFARPSRSTQRSTFTQQPRLTTCVVVFFNVFGNSLLGAGNPYVKVAGRVLFWSRGSNDAFRHHGGGGVAVSSPYLDGVKVTTKDASDNWSHVFSYATAGQFASTPYPDFSCPQTTDPLCAGGGRNGIYGRDPSYLGFVGDNFYCEQSTGSHDFSNDGAGCGGGPSTTLSDVAEVTEFDCNCAPSSNTPAWGSMPWFEVNVAATDADIVLSVCSDQDTGNENSFITEAEIWVSAGCNAEGVFCESCRLARVPLLLPVCEGARVLCPTNPRLCLPTQFEC